MSDLEKTETGVIRLESAQDFVLHSGEQLNSVIRTVYILTPELDKNWLGAGDLVERLKLAVIKNRRVQVKLLTGDPTEAVKANHPLIPLIRKLSRFEARVIPNEILEKQPLKYAAILVDRKQLVVKQTLDNFVGFAHGDDAQTVKRLTDEFEQYWRFAVEHADLRHVYL